MLIGLTSVTFRNLSCREIIDLACNAELDGIEWGGDIHVPPGDIKWAQAVKADTVSAGLSVLSYGSYFRTGTNDNACESFEPVLETALALGAPVIRIWAGVGHSRDCSKEYFDKVINDTQIVCERAAQYGITICYEYHSFTLNDNWESSLRLFNEAKCENLRTYWQPMPKLSVDENLDALKKILNHVQNIHVFHWTLKERLPLKNGLDAWSKYIDALDMDHHNLILEFVRDDKTAHFYDDARTLKKLLEIRKQRVKC